MRFLKPVDVDLLHEIFSKFNIVLSVEDGTIKGGLASELAEFKSLFNYKTKLISLGIPDNFISHATRTEQMKLCGIDEKSIFDKIKNEYLEYTRQQ
jgi:1-deoxy-D-xylulose-5-phosphate synthase